MKDVLCHQCTEIFHSAHVFRIHILFKHAINLSVIQFFFSYFYSFSQNDIFGATLCLSLFGLIVFHIARFVKDFSRNTIRAAAIFGSLLFSLFLLYDFNLIRMQELGSNDWGTAMRMAFILYLDIINLLLEILEAMGD